jgi:hypothetical protein
VTLRQGGHSAGGRPQRAERVVAFCLLALVLIVRIAYVFRYRVDSDEPQHLHVAWQWTLGLVSYRDFFDNHTPLFHIVMAPLLWCVGERADILGIARLFMVPFYLVALWAISLLGRSLFSARVGLWAPVFAGIFANYLFPTVEFRSDNLWAPAWLAALAVLFGGRPRLLRSFFAGVLAGISLGASMKTGLILGTLGAAAIVSLAVTPRAWSVRNCLTVLSHLACGVAGFAIVPGALLVFFWINGALPRLAYCIFEHNVLPPDVLVENRIPKWTALGITLALLIAVAVALFRRWKASPAAQGRVILFLHAGFTLAVLECAWPVMTRQNFLPVYPLVMLFLSALLVEVAQWISVQKSRPLTTPVLASLVGMMIVWTLLARPINRDLTLSAQHINGDALRLTTPDEFVMTYKGEVVFRRRPYYYVLEPFTRARLGSGLLPDEIAARLVATRTYVAMTSTLRFPPAAQKFLTENYIPVGPIRVAGKLLPSPDASGLIPFHIELPADYTLLHKGEPSGAVELDGKAFAGTGFIDAGTHQLRIPVDWGDVALLWTRAVERGFKVSPPGYVPERIGSEF